tara:strand:+ start:893 stop:1231 length:339 start_codon:yes stop_codon:yes gene_type:complete
MTTTYRIDTITSENSKDSLTDVCTQVWWEATALETVSGVTHAGTCGGSVDLDDPDPNNFKAYADLTESDVIAWVKAKMGTDNETRVDENLANQIALSKEAAAPTRKEGLPWG